RPRGPRRDARRARRRARMGGRVRRPAAAGPDDRALRRPQPGHAVRWARLPRPHAQRRDQDLRGRPAGLQLPRWTLAVDRCAPEVRRLAARRRGRAGGRASVHRRPESRRGPPGSLFVILDDSTTAGHIIPPGDLLAEPRTASPRAGKQGLHYLLRDTSLLRIAPAVLESVARIDGAIVSDASG